MRCWTSGSKGNLTRDRKVESNAVDVNESGLVAVVQNRYEDATWVEASSWLWDNGTKTRLAVGGARPFAVVSALNDHGDAVGYVNSFPQRRSARCRSSRWR